MSLLTGPNKPDPILADIIAAAKEGHFDRRRTEGPSILERTPVLELYETVSTMSPQRRHLYLLQIGRIRGEERLLSGGRRSRKTKRLLSGGDRDAA